MVCRHELSLCFREDTHKKVFFSGQTTKGVGRLTPPPPTTKQKTLFSINLAYLAQKWERKKNCQNPFQAIIRLKNGPLSH